MDNVKRFAQTYGPVAAEVGQRIGVAPDVLLGQWGLETGWGKSVIPGTNNLGNIKDFSGSGTRAVDNMTGSNDAYRSYATPSAFGSDFADLISRRYRGAVGAGSDANKFATALKSGGYAEDPAYVSKLAGATNLVRKFADMALSSVSGTANAATGGDMASKVKQAKDAGYSDDEIFQYLGQSQGFADKLKQAKDAGYSDAEVRQHFGLGAAQQQPKSIIAPDGLTPAPAGASKLKGSAAGGVVMGLRDAVDAGAQLLRRAVPESIGQAVDEFGNYLADAGLPVARTSGVAGVDQIVKSANAEYDASRKMAGRDGIDLARIGGNIANPVNRLIPMAGEVGAGALALRAGAQGALSGAATPVTDTENFGANKAAQVGLGGVMGAAGGVVADKLIRGASGVVERVRAAAQSGERIAANADELLQQAARDQGVDLNSIPQSILKNARDQVSQALRRNETMDARAVLRATEGRAVLGDQAALTLGQATRNPQQFAREMNLRGVEGAGTPLAERFAAQNNRLIQALNERGAAAAPGEFQAANRLQEALRGYDAGRQQNVASLYGQARSLNGGEIPLDANGFVSSARDTLRQQMRDLHLPTSISRRLDRFESGDTPLNISSAEQFKSILSDEIAEAQARGKSNVVNALWAVRNALDDAQPLVPAEAGRGGAALSAFNTARAAAAGRFEELRNNPALNAAVNGAEPDKFFQARVLNAPVREVRALLDTVPEQTDLVRQQVVGYLKKQALGGASDEVGKFSQSGYNSAMSKLGNEKLAAIFSPEELAQLRSIGNVASYIQAQPAGAAVNNSNTAAAVMNLLSQIGGTVGRFPFANIARNSINQFRNENAVASALAAQVPAQAKEAPVNALRALLPPLSGGLGSLGGEAGR